MDSEPLLATVRSHLVKSDDEATSLRVCETLQEVSGAPYFFEAVIAFAQKEIPFGAGYSEWATQMRSATSDGK